MKKWNEAAGSWCCYHARKAWNDQQRERERGNMGNGVPQTINIRFKDAEDEKETVNNPQHYTHGNIETIDFIEAITKDCTGIEAFCIGNVIKYVSRYKRKNGVEDLQKAKWYLDKLIDEGEE